MRVCVVGGVEYLKCSAREAVVVRSCLTFSRFDYNSGATLPFGCYSERQAEDGKFVFVVPRYFHVLSRDLHIESFENRCVDGGIFKKFSLVKELDWQGYKQSEWITKIVNEMQKNNLGGFGLAPCGSGKTLMGLEMARRIERPTLVVVSRSYQIEQWQQEAQNSFFCGSLPLELGVYQGEIRSNGNQFPVVVGMVNSLINEEDQDFWKSFGLVIFDESQHTPADMWLRILRKIRSRYVIGMTAGLSRTDKLEGMFRFLVGDVIADMQQESVKGGVVIQYLLLPYFSDHRCCGNTQNRMVVARRLSRNTARNDFLAHIIFDLYQKGRDIFVFSDLKEHLNTLYSLCVERGVPSVHTGFFTGDVGKAELEESKEKQVTFVTYSMAAEGLNIPRKDSIVCGTPPPSNIRQLKGRIERVVPGRNKPSPLVIDPVDSYWESLENKARRRNWLWKKEGMEVKVMAFGGTDHAEVDLARRDSEVVVSHESERV